MAVRRLGFRWREGRGLDRELYLHKVLDRIVLQPIKRLRELLPWNIGGIRPRLDQRNAA